jgi:cytochrome P450 PksS
MTFNLATREVLENPYPIYARLRQQDPIALIEQQTLGQAWFITRYDDVMAVLKDPRFSSDMRKRATQKTWRNRIWMPNIFRALQDSMVMADDPDHRRLRDLVHKAFTPVMIERMAGRVQEISDELLDRAARKPVVDLVADFALPLPLTVISEMLGVPEKDRLKFHKWTSSALNVTSGGLWHILLLVPDALQMFRFIKSLIKLRRANPQDDLITGLVQAENNNDRFSEDETLAMIFLLLFAGHETTVNLIGSGTLALLEHPDQFQKLHDHPELIDSAIEELLRYANPVTLVAPRLALADVEVGGQRIPAGSVVQLGLASANRDETAFDNADGLDITRNPNRHVAFGMGIHYCLGAPLARLEGRIAINTLVQRFPKMALAVPIEQLQWRSSVGVRGLQALPLKLNG